MFDESMFARFQDDSEVGAVSSRVEIYNDDFRRFPIRLSDNYPKMLFFLPTWF